MRAIDADKLIEKFEEIEGREYTAVFINQIIKLIEQQPTLELDNGPTEIVITAKAWDELPAEAKEKMIKALRGTTPRDAASDMGHLPATKCNIPMPKVKPYKEQEYEKTLIEVVKFYSHNKKLAAMILQNYIANHGPLSDEVGDQIKKILENIDE